MMMNIKASQKPSPKSAIPVFLTSQKLVWFNCSSLSGRPEIGGFGLNARIRVLACFLQDVVVWQPSIALDAPGGAPGVRLIACLHGSVTEALCQSSARLLEAYMASRFL